MPTTSLPPECHEAHHFFNKMRLHMEETAAGNAPPEMIESSRSGEDMGIERCISGSPHYAAIQAEIDTLLAGVNYPGRFNVPAWLNVISEQRCRPKPFLMVDIFTPRDEYMIAQLLEIRIRKPKLHFTILKLLLRAI